MIKTPKRINAARKRLQKFKNQLLQLDKTLSLGRVYKQDPFDCGVSGCRYCHPYFKHTKLHQEFKSWSSEIDLNQLEDFLPFQPIHFSSSRHEKSINKARRKNKCYKKKNNGRYSF